MIIPSIASADQLRIAESLDHFNGYPLHVDIEDGNFTPNITFGLETVRSIARYYPGRLDCHLFVTNPYAYIEELAKLGIWGISFQIEAEPFPLRTINHIKEKSIKAGIGINLATQSDAVSFFADSLDYVIVMTGEPDNNELSFYPKALKKIRVLRDILPKNVDVWADGGINRTNFVDCINSGADHLVFGRAAFNPIITIKELDELNQRF